MRPRNGMGHANVRCRHTPTASDRIVACFRGALLVVAARSLVAFRSHLWQHARSRVLEPPHPVTEAVVNTRLFGPSRNGAIPRHPRLPRAWSGLAPNSMHVETIPFVRYLAGGLDLAPDPTSIPFTAGPDGTATTSTVLSVAGTVITNQNLVGCWQVESVQIDGFSLPQLHVHGQNFSIVQVGGCPAPTCP